MQQREGYLGAFVSASRFLCRNRFYCLCYFLTLALASFAQRQPAASGLLWPANKGVVTTLAENQHIDQSIDGPGAMARFAAPTGIAVDASGTVYVADQYNHTIRKISTAGVVRTLEGRPGVPGIVDGTGPSARFNSPHEVLIDSTGALYVTDGGNAIRVIR